MDKKTYVAALRRELSFYEQAGRDERAKAVRAELRRLKVKMKAGAEKPADG